MKYLGLILAATTIITPAHADDCHIRNKVVAVKQVEQLIASFVAVPVAQYSAGYDYSYDAKITALEAKNAALESKLAAYEAQLLAFKNGASYSSIQGMTSPHALLLQRKCASCHDASAPKGKFTLFENGALVELSAEQKLLVLTKILTKEMPKTGEALTAEENAVVVEWLHGKTASK